MANPRTTVGFFVCILTSVACAADKGPFSSADRLRRVLLKHYDKHTRPIQHENNTTIVKMGTSVTGFHVDERHSTVEVDGWISMMWDDLQLRWNQSDYPEFQSIRFSALEIWRPDVVMYNSAINTKIDIYGNVWALGYPTGQMLWVPGVRLYALCDMDFTHWPNDEHDCELNFSSWTHDGNKIDLFFRDTKKMMESEMQAENLQWELILLEGTRNITMYPCCEDPYVNLVFKFRLKRKPTFFKAVALTPAIIVALTTLLVYWLPPMAKEKLIMAYINAVITCIFLIYFGLTRPSLKHVPVMVHFYSYSLLMVTLAIGTSILSSTLSKMHRPFPQILKNILTGYTGRVLGLNHLIKKITETQRLRQRAEVEMTSQSNEETQQEGDSSSYPVASQQVPLNEANDDAGRNGWILLAAATDRLVFLVHFIILIVIISVFA